jgi:hypothetical protein
MVQPLTNLTLTENDSWACKSSLDPRVDLFYGVLPGYLPEYLQQKLDASWQVSPLDTLKIIFNFGAVRFGTNATVVYFLILQEKLIPGISCMVWRGCTNTTRSLLLRT